MPATATTGVSAITGKDGQAIVNNVRVPRLTQWNINVTSGESAWGDSDSKGFTARKSGRHDATGSMTGKLDSTTNVSKSAIQGSGNYLQGFSAEVILWETKTTSEYWYFPCALITNFSLTVNQDTKEVVEWNMDYGADGIFYRPGQNSAKSWNSDWSATV